MPNMLFTSYLGTLFSTVRALPRVATKSSTTSSTISSPNTSLIRCPAASLSFCKVPVAPTTSFRGSLKKVVLSGSVARDRSRISPTLKGSWTCEDGQLYEFRIVTFKTPLDFKGKPQFPCLHSHHQSCCASQQGTCRRRPATSADSGSPPPPSSTPRHPPRPSQTSLHFSQIFVSAGSPV